MVNINSFTNKNEISRKDFDELVKAGNLEVYSQDSLQKYVESVASLIEKGEEGGELTSEEKDGIEIAKAEIGNLQKVVVVDAFGGQVVKVPLYIQEPMVDIEKGVYHDNSLNRKLGRVGKQWGGKKDTQNIGGKEVKDKDFIKQENEKTKNLGKKEDNKSDNKKFSTFISDHMDDDNFYDVVKEVAGEPEDDGESESGLLDRLAKLPADKQKLMMEKLGKKEDISNKVIGKTKSGKNIYGDINHDSHHRSFKDANDSPDWEEAFQAIKKYKDSKKD